MEKKDRKPGAFMCYARINDKDGTLTKLREKLSEEVEELIGEEFLIFQDIEDIKWGEDWKKRIDESLSEVTFFIPIITPSFFKSKYCCDELRRFLDREKKLGGNDLVLPIYYIETSLLEKEEAREISDKDVDFDRDIKTLARIINDRQRPSCADWRKLRPRCRNSFNSVEIYESLENLAIQIRDALDRLPPMRIVPSTLEQLKPKSVQPTKNKPHKTSSGPKNSRTEILVDQMRQGDYSTISEAIRAANPGDKILVRPGLYQEGLVINKPLEIVGEGERDEIVIQAKGMNAILFRTGIGRVANLTLRQIGNGNWYGVDIAQGRLVLENCDISSQSLACVAIYNLADPRIRGNKIHDRKQNGVFIKDNGRGTLEGNEIFGNDYPGVVIQTGGNPTLHHNKIYNGKQNGVLIKENGLGTLEENEIFGNDYPGVAIQTGGNPTLRHNKIYDGKQNGVLIEENGLGTLDKNEIFSNSYPGVVIQTGGNPTLRSNKIHDGKSTGVDIRKGLGILEDNDIFGNANVGVWIDGGSKPILRGNRINRNGANAIYICNECSGIIEDNDLRDNARGAWNTNIESKVKRARNLE